ncbi:extensin family protein [Microvirga solisilvae]|uniref:extensin-like domain-containing protein n=1 Tax=Microvirga solisilvae TaxID=2919498 RepID=UPI001FAEE3A3|nr:extensin family protein [Microvirga solisilvae]
MIAENGMAQAPMPPLPPPRPDRPAPPEDNREPTSVEEAAKEKDPAAEEAAAACIERLTQLGLRFEKRPPVQDNACKVDNPVSVSALADGIEVSPASLMECSFAEGLARWMKDVVAPRTSEHLQSAPTKLLIGTSYECRDQRSGSKLSEHAFGNGVDVMGFEFDKRAPVGIKFQTEGSPEAAFQSAVQKEACAIFTTVLGPGSDSAHGDHLHLDMRKRKADYRICQ